MHPHQDDSAIPHLPHSDDSVYQPCPLPLSTPQFDMTPHPLDDDYYSSQYQPDPYPQPCHQQYPPHPHLHIQTDLALPYSDPQSPYASTSTSASYPPPTPPSVGPPQSPPKHTDHVYTSPEGHTFAVQQLPYRVSHPDALPAGSLWHTDIPQQHYPLSGSEPLDSSPQWSPDYNVLRQSPSYTPPTLTYYPGPHGHSQPDAEQVQVSNMYSEEVLNSHTPQYTHSPLTQTTYPHDQHQGIFPSPIMRESPIRSSHGSDSFDHASHIGLSPDQVPPVNLEPRHHASFASALPSTERIFNSPLREPLHSIEQVPEFSEYQYRSGLSGPSVEQDFLHHRQVETGLQEHPPPPHLYSEGSSWVSGSTADYAHSTFVPPELDQQEQQSTPHAILTSHALPRHSPHAQMEPPFQSSLHEGRLSGVHSPARDMGRGSMQGPIQPPQLLEPAPIPRLSQPCRNSRTPSLPSPGAGPSTQAPFLQRHRQSPSSRPHSAQTSEPLLPTPIVPSQSHLANRRERTNRVSRMQTQPFRPFHPYPSHRRGEHGLQHIHYSEANFVNGGGGAGGVCIPPTPVFGLFGSYPLSRGPREQPLPGPTCAPESSSSVMRLVLTPPFRRPPPPPPPPTTAATRRPRMACFFCRKRKIACGPGPAPPSRPGEGEKEDEKKEDDDAPCNQCARRGLECDRPTESKRGVRRGKGRGKEGEERGDDESTLGGGSGSHITLELAPRPRPRNAPRLPLNMEGTGEDHSDDGDGDKEEHVSKRGRRSSEEK